MKIDFLSLFAICALVFVQCLGAEFLAYDDFQHIVANPALLNGNLLQIWSNSYFGLYIPVVYSMWSGVVEVFGLNPAVFHGLNLLAHATNGCLVYLLCCEMKLTRPASYLAALIFLLHPLQVESVAWVSGFRDVLSLTFCLLAVLLWLKGFTWPVLALTVLAMLTKPAAVMLPVLLFAFAFAKDRRPGFWKRNWHLAFGIAFALFLSFASLKIQRQLDYQAELSIDFYQRFLLVFDSFGFYISKFFFPVNLYPDYGRPLSTVFLDHSCVFNIFIFLVAAGALFFTYKKTPAQHKYLFRFGVGFAVILVLPVAGLVSFNYQIISTTADRYFYPGVAALAALLALAYEIAVQKNKKITRFAAFGLVVILAFSTFVQTYFWKNNEIFFEFMLEGNPQSYNATNNLGVIYQMKGDLDKALANFTKAHELRPRDITPIAGMLNIHYVKKDFAGMDRIADEFFQPAVLSTMILPNHSTSIAFRLYGSSLLTRNRKAEAFEYFCKAAGRSENARIELSEILKTLGEELKSECKAHQ